MFHSRPHPKHYCVDTMGCRMMRSCCQTHAPIGPLSKRLVLALSVRSACVFAGAGLKGIGMDRPIIVYIANHSPVQKRLNESIAIFGHYLPPTMNHCTAGAHGGLNGQQGLHSQSLVQVYQTAVRLLRNMTVCIAHIRRFKQETHKAVPLSGSRLSTCGAFISSIMLDGYVSAQLPINKECTVA